MGRGSEIRSRLNAIAVNPVGKGKLLAAARLVDGAIPRRAPVFCRNDPEIRRNRCNRYRL